VNRLRLVRKYTAQLAVPFGEYYNDGPLRNSSKSSRDSSSIIERLDAYLPLPVVPNATIAAAT
jgi:hypothetical protein